MKFRKKYIFGSLMSIVLFNILPFPLKVSSDMLKSKVGFTIYQDVTGSGVLPPEIPENGQYIHYHPLPSTGSVGSYWTTLSGLFLILLILIFFVRKIYKKRKGNIL